MRKKLRELRVLNNLSVEDMASLAGISLSHYYKIEQGRRNPTIIIAAKIAKILNSTVDELFFATNLDVLSKEAADNA